MIPVHPCGSVVDCVRSCYTTTIRFAAGGDPQPIRWFFTPPNAPLLGIPTVFDSRNWSEFRATGTWPDPVGEVSGAGRTWSNGDTPFRDLQGYHGRCGPDAAWAGELPLAGQVPLLLNAAAVAVACGGAAPALTCSSPLVPDPLYVVATQTSGSLAEVNGTYTLARSSPTHWESLPEPQAHGDVWWTLDCEGDHWLLQELRNGVVSGLSNVMLGTPPWVASLTGFSIAYTPFSLSGVFNIGISATP